VHATPSTKRLWLPSPLLLFLLPALLLIVVFFIVPIGITGVISLTSLDYRFRWDFVGLENFFALWQDTLIPRVLLNTGIYVFTTLLLFHLGLGLVLALPIALMCGFCEPLLHSWLGPGFSQFGPLLFLMAAHLCINVPIMPLLGLQLATNRVKVPAVVTMVMGIANLGLALVLAGPVHWNLYGIAAAGAIMLTVKNVLFTPIYAAHVLGKSSAVFFRELALIAGVASVSILLCRGLLWFLPIAAWDQLAIAGLGVSALYGLVAYRLILTEEERKMVRALVPFGRS